MVLLSWGLGGEELAGVRVDVVEVVVVVVVVVVGVVCRHLLDAGGDAPHRLHVRLRGRPALCPPPFVPSSPLGSHAPSRLSLGARGALALALGPLSSPLPLSRVRPPVPHALACSLSHLPSPCPLHLGSLPAPLRALPVPWPLPGPLPVSRVPPPVPHAWPARSPTSPRPAPCTWAPCPRPCAPFPCPGPSPAPCLSRRPLPALCSPPLLRPSWTTRRASRCLCSCGSVTPGGERSRVGGRTCRCRPGGKGLGGNGLGGLVWVWLGLAWARYFALSLPTAAAAAAAREASAARAGFFPRLRGVLGAAAWPAEAVSRPAGVAAAAPRAPSSLSFAAAAAADEAPVARAGSAPRFRGVLGAATRSAGVVVRPAGAAVATPRTPSSFSSPAAAAAGEAPAARAGSVATPRAPFLLSSAAAAALGDAPGSCAGAAPLVGGVPGAAVGAAAWLAAVSASCASGRGGAAGLAAWAAGAAVSAGPGPRAGGGGPTSTPASASLRSSRSARVSPVNSGEETGERERDRRWWRSSRWGDPSESAITVTLVGMLGGRRALPTTSWCISAVPWAGPCGALRGGGREGLGGRLWRQPRTAGGLRPSTGIRRGGGGATRPTRRATAPSLGRGPGPWAPGGRRAVSGEAAPGEPP